MKNAADEKRIKEIITMMPDTPGVYKYFDDSGDLIYIGKAKSLKKRVSSYFTKQRFENHKTAVMVSRIRHIDYTLVDTEIDALLLENSLIKEFHPRFNVNLKDDKTYPFIRITNERFPRIFPTRNPVKDGSEYFGPYASVRMMNTVLDMIKQIYPTRNCNFVLSEQNIMAGKFKVCLEYQIGNCKGPCENLQSEEDYMQSIRNIKNILRGNIGEVIDHLRRLMTEASAAMRFEQAADFKKKLEILENYQSRSTVVNKNINDVDVFSITEANDFAFVSYLKVMNGMIIQTQTIEYRKKMDESADELLQLAIAEIRERYHSTSKEIIVPFEPDIESPELRFTVPKAGEKRKLLELSLKNALFYKKEKLDLYEKLNPDLKTERVLKQVQQDLRLADLPVHMECFDNSNIQGAYPVSALVVFKNARPSKKDYRHFNVRTVEGPNDFATMEEVVYRRYKRLVEENTPLPQLIVIDGGKGQLGAAVSALKKLEIYGKVAVLGIAKKLEELYYPDDPLPLHLDKKSESLRIIQQMRDEAHRFGITHHRNRRSKGTVRTELSDIKGIGEETARKLLTAFKSVKGVRTAGENELAAVIGRAKARLLMGYFASERQEEEGQEPPAPDAGIAE